MHVMIVNIFFAPHSYGGATIVAEEVARHLGTDHGVTVSAVSAMARDDLPPYATLKVEARGIVNTMINLPAGRTFAQHYANPDVTAQIARIARQTAPDVVHLHCLQEIGADVLPALKALGLPVVLSLHDFWWLCERQFMIRMDGQYCGQDPVRIEGCRGCVDDWGRAATRQAHLGAAAASADIVTAPSDFARGLYARSGFAPDRLAVWENGVHLPRADFFEQQAARRKADRRHVFGFVGGPSNIKGWPLLTAAFSGLDRDDFSGQLVDGSRDGSWYNGRDLSGLSGDWSVVPRYDQNEIDRFFAGIDTLLFLSQWKETFGLTIREALSRGIRVIQTDSGGTMEHDAGATRVRVIPIGCAPDILRDVVMAELDGPRGCAPLRVRNFGEQATEFLDLVRPLTASNGPQRASPRDPVFRTERRTVIEAAE